MNCTNSDIQEVGFADLPEEVGNVLGKCCHMNPKERYQSAAELIKAFESLREHFGKMPEDTKLILREKAQEEKVDREEARS